MTNKKPSEISTFLTIENYLDDGDMLMAEVGILSLLEDYK